MHSAFLILKGIRICKPSLRIYCYHFRINEISKRLLKRLCHLKGVLYLRCHEFSVLGLISPPCFIFESCCFADGILYQRDRGFRRQTLEIRIILTTLIQYQNTYIMFSETVSISVASALTKWGKTDCKWRSYQASRSSQKLKLSFFQDKRNLNVQTQVNKLFYN